MAARDGVEPPTPTFSVIFPLSLTTSRVAVGLENTPNTGGPWVIAVGDSTSCARLADDPPARDCGDQRYPADGRGEAGLAGEPL